MPEVFQAKKIYHRTINGIHMRIGAIAAAFNILLKMNDYKPSMTWFAQHPIYGNLLMAGDRIVGAYLAVEGQAGGSHPLTTRLEELGPPARY